MKRQENLFNENDVEKIQSNIDLEKIQEQLFDEQQIKSIVSHLIEQNEQLLVEINNLAKIRKNKNVISPQMSLLTNKLERNLIRISRLVPPESLADPDHVQQEKERFLKFYRGRNAPKKIGQGQQMANGTGNTPTKINTDEKK